MTRDQNDTPFLYYRKNPHIAPARLQQCQRHVRVPLFTGHNTSEMVYLRGLKSRQLRRIIQTVMAHQKFSTWRSQRARMSICYYFVQRPPGIITQDRLDETEVGMALLNRETIKKRILRKLLSFLSERKNVQEDAKWSAFSHLIVNPTWRCGLGFDS